MKIENLSQIMKSAWSFYRITGECFSKCLRCAWINYKLVQEMQKGVVKFYFQKVDGSIREAWGTLNRKYTSNITELNKRAKNETVQIYFDTEKQEFRCFKKLNLVSII